jgi:hypothetical protein
VIHHEPLRHHAAHRVPDDHRLRKVERIHEGADILGEVCVRVAFRRLARPAVPALRQREHTNGRRQPDEHRLERPPRVGRAVQADDGHARRQAVFRIFQCDAGRKRDRFHHLCLLSAMSAALTKSGTT